MPVPSAYLLHQSQTPLCITASLRCFQTAGLARGTGHQHWSQLDAPCIMATKLDPDIDKTARAEGDEGPPTPPDYGNAVVQEDSTYAYDDSRKLGITGSVFLILNKMIGTGSMCTLDRLAVAAHFNQFSLRHRASSPRPDPSVFLCSSGSLVRIHRSSRTMQQLTGDTRRHSHIRRSLRLSRVWTRHSAIRRREELPRTRLPPPQICRNLRASFADDPSRLLVGEQSCVWPLCPLCIRFDGS